MSWLPHLGFVVGVWSAVTLASPQQQNIEPPPILSVRTDLVTLTVTVVDQRGRLVTGLGSKDFTVYDNEERQVVQLFSNEDLPATIGLVIDCSGSTRPRRNDIAAAGSAFAFISNPVDEFFTLNFNESVWPGLPPGAAFTDDPHLLRAALSAAPARGMTALYDAIARALDHVQLGTHDRKALIVVSDGGDNASSQKLDDVLERARRASAVIYSVALVDPGDHDARPQVLKQLARETGGRAFTPRRAADVLTAFEQIAREIRAGYTIGFSPADTRDGGFHAIRVVADSGGGSQLIVRTRAGYYAGPPGRTIR